MADELKDEGQEVQKEEQHIEPHQPTDLEQRAMDQGWVPQEEWAGDPDDWRPAKEFIDRGELFKKIDDQKRELKQLRTTMEEFGKHHARVREIEYKRALDTLKAQKKEALEEQDAAAVIEIDDKIAEVREAQRADANAPKQDIQQTGPNPEFVRWEARNTWYKVDRAMKAVADEIARGLVARGESDVSRILTEVDKEIRKTFPAKFENPNRSKPGSVEGTSKSGGRGGKDEVYMTDTEKAIMKRIIATGAITKEKYLEEYKARKEG